MITSVLKITKPTVNEFLKTLEILLVTQCYYNATRTQSTISINEKTLPSVCPIYLNYVKIKLTK